MKNAWRWECQHSRKCGGERVKGRHGSDQFTKLLFESGYKLCVPVDASVSVEVVVTRKSNTVRNFPSTVLQCPVVLTSFKPILASATKSTLRFFCQLNDVRSCLLKREKNWV